jgi:hypothetical protein
MGIHKEGEDAFLLAERTTIRLHCTRDACLFLRLLRTFCHCLVFCRCFALGRYKHKRHASPLDSAGILLSDFYGHAGAE